MSNGEGSNIIRLQQGEFWSFIFCYKRKVDNFKLVIIVIYRYYSVFILNSELQFYNVVFITLGKIYFNPS